MTPLKIVVIVMSLRVSHHKVVAFGSQKLLPSTDVLTFLKVKPSVNASEFRPAVKALANDSGIITRTYYTRDSVIWHFTVRNNQA